MALGTYLGIFCMIAAIPLAVHLIVCAIKKWKFDWLMWAVSAVTSLIGVLPLSMSFDNGTDTWGSRLLWMICFFAIPLVCGLAGVCFVEGIRAKKITVHRPFNRLSSFVIAIIGSLVLGGVGQVIYDMGSKTVTTVGTKDVVLLLDGSSSMNGYKEPCVDAACVLVDSLDEDCRVQVVSFAAKVLGETDFLYMDASGKSEVQRFMQNIDVTGGTNFDAALDVAMDTLEDNAQKDRGQAVILLTDGDGPLSDNVKKSYQSSDVKLYTIRITGNFSNSGASELLQLVQATGGFDTEVSVTGNGQVDADEMIEAFRNAFAGSQETESTDRLLLFACFDSWIGAPTPLLLLRLVIFGLYSILIAWVYYGPQKVGGMVFHGILGMGLAIFSWGSQNSWADFIGFIICFHSLFWAAYTVYRPADGVDLGAGNAGIHGGTRGDRPSKIGKASGGKRGGRVGRKAKKEDAHV